MKKIRMTMLAVMILAMSAAALAAPMRDEGRPQEYSPYPEANSACCGGEVREERGNAPQQ